MTRRVSRPGLAALSFLITLAPCFAGTLSIGPVQDNSIYEEDFSSNGAGEHLFSGHTAFLSARRALIAFDVAGNLPDGATITSVSLQLTCTQSPFINDAPQPFDLHRLTDDWGEAGSDAGDPGGFGTGAEDGDATWSERFFNQGMLWATPGGDFDPAVSGSASVGSCSEASPTAVTFSTDEMLADVQGWVDDPATNFGWIVIGDEVGEATARRFASRENTDQDEVEPTLTIEFEGGNGDGGAVPASSTAGTMILVLMMSAASAFLIRRRAVERN